MIKDFNNITSKYGPIYVWSWNDKATKDKIKTEIDSMHSRGIKGFYVIAEPDNFRPGMRNTLLSPEYLSDEYLDLLYYASDYAESKGMHTWLYNEGGFPSGMACGKVLEVDPKLSKRLLVSEGKILDKGEVFKADDNLLAAFIGTKRIKDGYKAEKEEKVACYYDKTVVQALGSKYGNDILTDIGNKRTTEIFMDITYKPLVKKFKSKIPNTIDYMFDDEAKIGTWSNDFDKIFKDIYGYDICDFLPFVANHIVAQTYEEKKARVDYHHLLGTLTKENYFLPMKKCLNDNKLKLVGHLDLDHKVDGFEGVMYYNSLMQQRCFDIPGIDVIWSQIKIPKNNGESPCEDFKFFPLVASSAARQMGTNLSLTESFAVFGSHIDGNEMRYVVNFQAVRGINIFNFSNTSLGTSGILPHQYRPNFIGEIPFMNMLEGINNYTQNLSYIMQNATHNIKTALFYPYRSILAGGNDKKEAIESFVKTGDMLERLNVPFDLIDEDFILSAKVENGELIGENVRYENVFMPECPFEKDEVIKKLEKLNSNINPCAYINNANFMIRPLLDKNDRYYFIYNEGGKKDNARIRFFETSPSYIVDLDDLSIEKTDAKISGSETHLDISLYPGEAVMVLFTDDKVNTKDKLYDVKEYKLGRIYSYKNREYIFTQNGGQNVYYDENYMADGLSGWDKTFSGEYTYKVKVEDDIDSDDTTLDLGKVNHVAKVFVNDNYIRTLYAYPYRVNLNGIKKGDEIKIIVSNTVANACANTDYFDKTPIEWVGPYHEKMIVHEKKAVAGGLFGEVKLFSNVKK